MPSTAAACMHCRYVALVMFDNLMLQYDLASSIVDTRKRASAMAEVVATATHAIEHGYEDDGSEGDLWSYLFFFEGHYVGDF